MFCNVFFVVAAFPTQEFRLYPGWAIFGYKLVLVPLMLVYVPIFTVLPSIHVYAEHL